MRVHAVFEGAFSGAGKKTALLLWEGCEWRSNGAVIVTQKDGGWVAGQFLEDVPFGPFDHCEVARSPKWGDRLVCAGSLLTHNVGTHRMRGSAPFASTLTSFYFANHGDSEEFEPKLSMLLFSEDPAACQGPGARGEVVRSELGDFVIKDLDGDGADDVRIDLRYLFASAPSKTACVEKDDLKSTSINLLRRKSGFETARNSVALLERLKLQ